MEDWNAIARELGFDNEAHMWLDLYEQRGKTIIQLSKMFNKGTATIRRRLDRVGVSFRSKGGANNYSGTTWKLFLLNPMFLYGEDEKTIGRMVGMHYSTVYKFKRDLILKGEEDETSDNQSDGGS